MSAIGNFNPQAMSGFGQTFGGGFNQNSNALSALGGINGTAGFSGLNAAAGFSGVSGLGCANGIPGYYGDPVTQQLQNLEMGSVQEMSQMIGLMMMMLSQTMGGGASAGGSSPAGNIASNYGGSSPSSSPASSGSSPSSSSSSSGSAPTDPPSGNVKQWIDQAKQVLEQQGIPASKLSDDDINIIIQHESSGNPNAQNNTDSNAAAGHPSKGLMQTIDGTFNEYAVAGHKNIWNPVDNIVAGVRYAISRYGSLDNVPGVKAVKSGGSYVGY